MTWLNRKYRLKFVAAACGKKSALSVAVCRRLVSLLSVLLVNMSISTVKISLRVHPRATRNEVMGFTDGVLQVRVSAPPIKGKANKELITFLSRLLGVGKSQIDIIGGHTTRDKVIAINGLSQEDIMKRLSPG